MRKKLLAIVVVSFPFVGLLAGDICINTIVTPFMVERDRNIISEIYIDNRDGAYGCLDEIVFDVKGGFDKSNFNKFELLYSGQASMVRMNSSQWALQVRNKEIGGSQQVYASPRYSMLKATAIVDKQGQVIFKNKQPLSKGKHYFFVSSSVKKLNRLTDSFILDARTVRANNKNVEFTHNNGTVKRFGVGVRQHGDDGVFSYRIPGLVTSKKGTLLAVYDVRYTSWHDLQDDIDVGVSRSTDGGRTWEKMRIVMDAGEYGGLPHSQNGIGDPAILVDEKSGDILVVGVWTHGLNGSRAWDMSSPGLEPIETAQLMMTRSRDDGKTWSPMVNLTKQVKDPSWRFLLQGPGCGITMDNGTLVFPIQYIDSLKVPSASIMYSHDRGNTWKTHAPAKANTTESQVVEVEPGVLMLNMRDNNRKGRAVTTTKDMGMTWETHPTSNKDLPEPVCMASLIRVRSAENTFKKDLLLFSNPNNPKRATRSHITIKASLDNGNSWNEENQLMIDEDLGWGYSCLSMVSSDTVGILYESSTGQLIFQAIPLSEVVKSIKP